MNLFQILELVGVPSIFAITVYIIKLVLKLAKQVDILQKSQKAQMRAQLLKDYTEYQNRGFVRQLELDEWMNQYNAYHELVGVNGVLDSRKEDLLKMPCHN
ncbi:MAG: hypothetical protein KBT03_12825 [Bacteroidales bacterium]|nr:hypothetical protein [Candidatus Scybalousia scybalohippi]